MKGIVLAGGTGSRLWPLTFGVSKQLLPVYDKPLIYYPLSVLMLANVRDILIVCRAADLAAFRLLLGDGSDFGIRLSFAVQAEPNGIAEALLIAEDFVGEDQTWLVLGDNLIFGNKLRELLRTPIGDADALVFAHRVSDPSSYAVVTLKDDGKPKELVEKPTHPVSNLAVPGLYRYPKNIAERVRELRPSARGELEITDLNRLLLNENRLSVEVLPRGTVWLDAGSFDSLMEAGSFVQTIEKRQGFKIACLEEIALELGWIDHASVEQRAASYGDNAYGSYLRALVSPASWCAS